ncbi:Ig-like domain-containing protein [Myxococcus sp. AM009]|uniref:Ig-like domain-containing protein n=1 Tax=unclassified Myxococcus TaxID=2648731 RepID=UPI001595E942|nr:MULTISPECIES: Ig-like domain-containing protein [unclassified Myxococcus]NVI97283.1 Ig-like domain-containing protein [Myxococcus sp. AM009]NVJ12915.1 Ig-like domain-containing protein [Myxococcus sp. AM010]
MSLRALFPYVTLTSLFTACINVPDIVDAQPDAGDITEPDGGPLDGEVTLTSVDGATHVRATVTLQISTSVQQPDAVELSVGNELLASLQPPYTYTWDTTSLPETTHTLVARVTKGGRIATSDERRFVVDRTPPTIISREPAPDDDAVAAGSPIRVRISEPVQSATLTGTSVRLRLGGVLIDRTVELTEDETLLTIIPTETGPVPHEFELALADSITDLAGNRLEDSGRTWSWRAPAWLSVGPTAGVSPPWASSPHLHLAPGTAPLLTWRNATSISVRSFQEGNWNNLGGDLNVRANDIDVFPSAPTVINHDGTPFVSWTEEEIGGGTAYVRAWVTSDWQSVGDAVDGAGKPDLHFGTESSPWLTVIQDGPEQGATSIRVRRQNGAQWENVGGAFRAVTAELGRVSDVSLRFHAAVPYIAWSEFELNEQNHPINGRVHVWRRVSNEWVPLGSALKTHSSDTSASQVDMNLDGNGHPLVVWSETTPNGPTGTAANVYVSRWDGSQWVSLGSGLSATPGNTPADHPSLAMAPDGTPMVAWRESDGATNRVHVRQWAGFEWRALHGSSNVLPDATSVGSLNLQVDADGIPWVACEATAEDGHPRIFVYRFNR